ncbi:hypothetical protein HD554DRAFT_1442366 [Boletus coccyginus]|nr:hypothetical protein HD554DRAFT_1442366 [Boletus coccyginus]
MALLAPSDWHPPRDHTMDPSANATIPRQRSSPANDHASSPHPQHSLHQHAQPPYPYPVQQAQGSWNPSVSAQPFYPSFYQNQHQQLPAQPYPLHPHPSQNHYFDPAANAQLAQWAYQQMMFNAQAQLGSHPPSQRSGSASAPASPAEYFSPNQLFNHFPSSTPPPHQQHPPHHAPAYTHRTASADTPRSQQQYEGFHPYRRPPNAPGRSQEPDRRPPGSFQPPYARGEASDSSTSVNSSNSNHANPNGNSRQRTSSLQGQPSSHSHPNGSSSHQGSVRGRSGPSPQTVPQPPPPGPDASRSRTGSGSSAAGASTAPSRTSSAHPLPHHRTSSSSSSASSAPTHRPSASISASSTSTPSSHSHHPSTQARPSRPSPLSQGSTYTTTTSPPQPSPTPRTQPSHASAHADSRRISKDDSDLATMLENSAIGLGGTSAVKSGGLKGRLRRALSLNAAQALHEEDESPGASSKATGSEAPSPTDANDASSTVTEGTPGTPVGGNGATTTTTGKKRSRASSLFNSRLNASTDNISLSSTMSSASVVIRKIGSMGKLARRNSLAGITSLFKDKKDKEKEKEKVGDVAEAGSSSGKKPRKKKDAKGSVAEPAVSHAVAELDRGSGSGGDWSDASMSGLSPAAKLARQHTLKSNAEAAARAKAAAEVQAQQAKSGSTANGSVPVPSTWEKNTTTAKGDSPGPGRKISEDGTRVVVEEDSDSGSENGHEPGYSAPQGQSYISEGWDDDEPWPEEEDDTIRIPVGPQAEDEEVLEWANTMRRSIDRSRAPAKGILKGAEEYNQDTYVPEQAGNPAFNRIRSNSYNSHPGTTSELGPLARIPSPDPDHIDGLHRHSSSHSNANTGGNPEAGRSSPHHGPLFSLPNSSAPALSTIPAVPATLSHRSASGPAIAKKLVFADSLSVYDTFSSTVYDRRSEPATWSRLTPALAQRIKEELNSYKMEEMEVHACSRMHTQFFI